MSPSVVKGLVVPFNIVLTDLVAVLELVFILLIRFETILEVKYLNLSIIGFNFKLTVLYIFFSNSAFI